MARPKRPSPDHNPQEFYLYESAAVLPKARSGQYRPGKTADDRLPVHQRARVRRACLSYAKESERRYYLRWLGITGETAEAVLDRLSGSPHRVFPTITHPGVIRL